MRLTGLRVRAQHHGNDIVRRPCEAAGCSVAVGPNKHQPFPFSVPTHHPNTSVTQDHRP